MIDTSLSHSHCHSGVPLETFLFYPVLLHETLQSSARDAVLSSEDTGWQRTLLALSHDSLLLLLREITQSLLLHEGLDLLLASHTVFSQDILPERPSVPDLNSYGLLLILSEVIESDEAMNRP